MIVRSTELHESRSLTLVLYNTINFAQQKPDAVLLFVMNYLVHKSDHKGRAQEMGMGSDGGRNTP